MLAMMIRTYTASRSSSHPEDTYWCKGCKRHFDTDDYQSVTVTFSPKPIPSSLCFEEKCGSEDECRYAGKYFVYDSGSTEDAWYCALGCFHHDDGSCPDECEGECGIAEFSTQTFTVEVWECGKCQATYAADDSDYADRTIEEALASAREDAGKCCA